MKLTPAQVLANLQFEDGQLVKIRGARPEYMDGYRLIAQVQELAVALKEAVEAAEKLERLWGSGK